MIKLFAPSYKRAQTAITQRYLPECTYVVGESEADAYQKAGHKLWAVPDNVQGNISRVRNFILNNADTDQLVMLDDDIKQLGIYQAQKRRNLTTAEAMAMIEDGFDLVDQAEIHYWGLNVNFDKQPYRENTPFSLTAFIGGPFQGCNALDLRYDERIPLKEDYDMALQVLNKYRRVLRFNQYHYLCDQHQSKGGCASVRTIEREQQQFDLLRKKWGAKIVKRDKGNTTMTRKKQPGYDLNPIIKFPIPGV